MRESDEGNGKLDVYPTATAPSGRSPLQKLKAVPQIRGKLVLMDGQSWPNLEKSMIVAPHADQSYPFWRFHCPVWRTPLYIYQGGLLLVTYTEVAMSKDFDSDREQRSSD